MNTLNTIMNNVSVSNITELHDMVHQAETNALMGVIETVILNGGEASIEEMIAISGGTLSSQFLVSNFEQIGYFDSNRKPLYDNYVLNTRTERAIKYVIECDSLGNPKPNSKIMASTKRVTMYQFSRKGFNKFNK